MHAWIQKRILRVYRVGRLVFLDLDEVYEDIKRFGAPGNPAGTSDDSDSEPSIHS